MVTTLEDPKNIASSYKNVGKRTMKRDSQNEIGNHIVVFEVLLTHMVFPGHIATYNNKKF